MYRTLRVVILAVTSAAGACASAGSGGADPRAGVPGLTPGSYSFEFSAPGVRHARGLIEPYDYVVDGFLTIEDGTTVAVQFGQSLEDRRNGCEIDVARQLIRAGSKLDIRCDEVRLELEHTSGEIVGGRGFARIQTILGSTYECESWVTDRRTGQRRCERWSPQPKLDWAWRDGALRLERFGR